MTRRAGRSLGFRASTCRRRRGMLWSMTVLTNRVRPASYTTRSTGAPTMPDTMKLAEASTLNTSENETNPLPESFNESNDALDLVTFRAGTLGLSPRFVLGYFFPLVVLGLASGESDFDLDSPVLEVKPG